MVYSFGWRAPVVVLLFCVPYLALSSPWEQVNAPSEQSSQAIGSYANGCLAGATALPLQGVGYQVLRSHRQRYYAHPSAVSFVQRLGNFQSNTLIHTF